MASNEIKILLGGDASGIVKASQQANVAINSVNKAAVNTGKSLTTVKPGANEAAAALTNLGRVAQDLPFGFVGIQNNLNPLLESFQRVKASTGSTGTALKALAGSLAGAGGVGLALSVVSAGFLIFQNGIAGFNRKTKEAKETTDELAKGLQEVAAELGRDAAKVTTLVNALSGGGLNTEQRKKALADLKAVNVEFFGALKEEEGTIKNLSLAYDGYLKRLADIGRAKAIESQLTKLFDKKLQLQLTIDPKFTAATDEDTQRLIGKLRKDLEKLGGEVKFNAEGQATGEKEAANFFDKTNSKIEQRIALQTKIQELERGNKFLKDENFRATEKEINQIDLRIKGLSELQKSTGNFDIAEKATSGASKQDAVLKRLKDELQGLQKQLEVTNKLREAGVLPINRENDALDLQLKILEKLNQIDIREVQIKAKPKLEIDPVLNELEIQKAFQEAGIRQASTVEVPLIIEPKAKIDIQKSLGLDKIPDGAFDGVVNGIKKAGERAKVAAQQIVIDLGAIMEDFAVNAAVSIGENIGNIISGIGSAGDILKGFASLIGDVLIQLGKYVITAGVQMLALKKAFDNFIISNPQVAIVAGIAAVALGTALKNSFGRQKVPAFADGVVNFGGGVALVGERGPELVNLPRGSDVIPNHLLGGNIEVVVAGVMRGDDIYFTNQKVTRRKRRI